VPTSTTVRAVSSDSRARDIDGYLHALNAPDEKQRIEAMMQLGRLRAEQSVDVLSGMLSNDRSPAVREAAARALGLVGSPRALNALQHAAQSDDESTVRNSASYAADVIRSRMPR
jgi:HEAT repeat protein